MSKHTRITTTAHAFNAAGSELATAMLEQLQKEDPTLTAKLAQVLTEGERMVVALEISPGAPSIWWATINDLQQLRRIMTIPGAGGAQQH
jgi:hypothetical protein